MKIRILSDLHIEHGDYSFAYVPCDCVILAGDIQIKRNALKWIQHTFPGIPVIYVLGNHEFYGDKIPSLTEKLKDETSGTNIHVLENESVSIGGFRFFGATLWTDMRLFPESANGPGLAREVMTDYKRIRLSPSFRRIRPSDTRMMHHHTLISLKQELPSSPADPLIVISHHAPSIRSLPENRINDPLSCAYASHLDEFVTELNPLLWIHGHIHTSVHYNIGQTQVICNPRGYADEPNPGFHPNLIVDLAQMKSNRVIC